MINPQAGKYYERRDGVVEVPECWLVFGLNIDNQMSFFGRFENENAACFEACEGLLGDYTIQHIPAATLTVRKQP